MNSKEKCELYGIEVKSLENLFRAYYMEETKLCGGNNKEIHLDDKVFPLFKKKIWQIGFVFMKKIIIMMQIFFLKIVRTSKVLGFKIEEPE